MQIHFQEPFPHADTSYPLCLTHLPALAEKPAFGGLLAMAL